MKCKNCRHQNERKFRLGLCDKCYQYKKRTNKDRPEKLWIRRTNCENCNALNPLYLLLCQSCYSYKYRYGINRPPSLYNKKIVKTDDFTNL